MRASILVSILAAFFGPLFAGTMSVAWDPVPDATGYNLYYGTSPSVYSNVVDVGNTTQATLTITDCADYFVAAKAYNSAGESAGFSNEIQGWARPAFTTPGKISAIQGDQFTYTVNGSNFQSGAALLFDATSIPTDISGTSLVRVGLPAILDCNQAQALISIDPPGAGARAMEIGTFNFDVRVVNPDGSFGTQNTELVVGFDAYRSDINRSDSDTTDRVDGKDLAWLAYSYGVGEGDPRWNPDADLSGDGFVDGEDLALLAVGFGQCWTGSSWSVSACP